MKGYIQDDKSIICLSRQETGMKVLEGNYCDKAWQIGAIGLWGTTVLLRLNEEIKKCNELLLMVVGNGMT